ncbi:DASS family sodium-coupled anion symporter [Candidatus Bathyarchaeota archaeon]|nr:DASS family sodium-coupled anion symporter [Candidatus Bathyarchaeota archaeon]
MNRNKIIQIILLSITIIISTFHILLYPIEGKVLGIAILALVLWSLYPDKHFQGSILIILLLAIVEANVDVAEFISSLFRTYGGSGFWIILSGFILAKAIEVSGLGTRIALRVATSLGYKPRNIILSIGITNLVISPLSPSTTAKAFLLLPICRGFIEVFNIKKGKSNYAAAVMLIAMATNNIASTAFLTATVPNPISADYLKNLAGIYLDWVGWFKMALPLTLISLIASYLILIRLIPPEVLKIEVYEKIELMKKEKGPLSTQEKIVAGIFLMCLILWMTERFNPFNAGIISLILSSILLIPNLGIISFSKFNQEIPWGSITLFAASMFLARAVSKYNAIEPLARSFFELVGLERLGSTLFIVGIITVSMLLHVIFTSTTVYATVILPLIISLTNLQNIQLGITALPLAFITPIAIIFPINTIPNIIYYGEGWFTDGQMLKYGLILSIICTLIVLLIGIPYWQFLGLIH